MKILFVDDDRIRYDLLIKRIPKEMVDWAPCGANAIAMLEKHMYNVVMLDNDLGDTGKFPLEGVDIAKWIADNYKGENTTFVAHSMNPICHQRIIDTLKEKFDNVYSVPKGWTKIALIEGQYVHFS